MGRAEVTLRLQRRRGSGRRADVDTASVRRRARRGGCRGAGRRPDTGLTDQPHEHHKLALGEHAPRRVFDRDQSCEKVVPPLILDAATLLSLFDDVVGKQPSGPSRSRAVTTRWRACDIGAHVRDPPVDAILVVLGYADDLAERSADSRAHKLSNEVDFACMRDPGGKIRPHAIDLRPRRVGSVASDPAEEKKSPDSRVLRRVELVDERLLSRHVGGVARKRSIIA